MIRSLSVTRYITPLREGGSLPAVVEADDGELYVMKFAGAGQGRKALIAELVAGEIGRRLGLSVPEIIFLDLDGSLGRNETDFEIKALLTASTGLNLGLRYLPKAFAFNPALRPAPSPALASLVVWFDAYVTNVDRTPRNVNLLLWQNGLWLIDHGAALYFHHDWNGYLERSLSPFPLVKDHVLLRFARELTEADEAGRAWLNASILEDVVGLIPTAWLGDEPQFASPSEHRQAYAEYLRRRLEASSVFVEEARRARSKFV